MNFATNTLAPFVLTEALLPLLRAGGPGARVVTVSSGGQYTEPLVGGGGGGVGGSAALQWEGRGFDGTRQYARDKRRQTALCERWGRDPANADVLVASCHPGWADTDAVKTSLPQFYDRLKPRRARRSQGGEMMMAEAKKNECKRGRGSAQPAHPPRPAPPRPPPPHSLRTPEQGADTVVWLACAPAARVQPPGSPRGAFYFDRARVSPHLALGHTEYKPGAVDELAKQLTAIVDGVLSAAPSSAGATAAKA